jgi:hypothetical protein
MKFRRDGRYLEQTTKHIHHKFSQCSRDRAVRAGYGGGGRAGSHERASTCPLSQLHLPSSQVPSFRTSSLVTSSPRH